MLKNFKFLKRTIVIAIIIAIFISFSLAGCKVGEETGQTVEEAEEEATPVEEVAEEEATPAEEEATPAEEEATPVEEVEEKEPVTIEFWALWTKGEANQEVFGGIAEDYMAENPNVTVNIKWVGRDVLTKVSAALKAGVDKPDIVNQGFNRLYSSLVQEDLALPLDEYMETNAYGEDVPFEDVFLPGMFDAWRSITGNKTYFIPHYVYTNLIWYDENKFKEYGIKDTPKTWDELLDTCETIKENGGDAFILDMFPEYVSFYMYWLTNRLLGPGQLLMASLDPSGAGFDDPGFLAAAQKLEEFVNKGYFIEGYQGYQYPAGQIDWAQGQATFLLNGSWILPEVRDNLPDEFIPRAFPFPTVDGKGDLGDVEYYPSGFAILKDTLHPDVCVDFIKYYITEEAQRKIADIGAASPVRKGVSTFKDVEDVFNNATTSHHPMDNLQGMNPEWYLKVFNPLNTELIIGSITAEEYISEIKQQTIDFWENK